MKRQRINFLPKEHRPKFKVSNEILMFGVLLFAFAYCGESAVRYTWVSDYREEKLANLSTQSHVLSEKVQALSAQNQAMDKNDRALAAIQKVIVRKNYWSEIFKELSILIPDGVWLTNFADQNSIAAAKPKASVDVKPSVENKVSPETQLSLIGEADSQEIVAKFLTILEKSHHFSGVQIKYVEKEENIEPSRFKFEFTVPVTVLTGGGT